MPHEMLEVRIQPGQSQAAAGFTPSARQQILAVLVEEVLDGPQKHLFGVGTLSKRFLPPGKRIDLYNMYVSYCAAAGAQYIDIPCLVGRRTLTLTHCLQVGILRWGDCRPKPILRGL